MIFIKCVQHDNESVYIYAICAIDTCVLCTDSMITSMYVCMLLAIYSILPCLLLVCAYMLCKCYKCIQIFIVYGYILNNMKYLTYYISLLIIFMSISVFAFLLDWTYVPVNCCHVLKIGYSTRFFACPFGSEGDYSFLHFCLLCAHVCLILFVLLSFCQS